MEAEAVKSDLVVILDSGVFSLCISGTSPLSSISNLSSRVIILSGGRHSVHTPGAPSFPNGFVYYVQKYRVFILGVCGGLPLIVQKLAGEVSIGDKHNYGRMENEMS